jgi:hypothetical protein
MKKIIKNLISIFLLLLVFSPKTVRAADYGEACSTDADCSTGICRPGAIRLCGCSSDADCSSGGFCNTNNLCIAGSPTSPPLATTAPLNDAIGEIDAPPGVSNYNAQAGGIGIILFFSNLIKLITVVAGIWTMLNFILAGFTYVTSADNPSAIEKIGSKLSLSVVGLAIIVASYLIAAIIGLILFNDASFIINPEIPSISAP